MTEPDWVEMFMKIAGQFGVPVALLLMTFGAIGFFFYKLLAFLKPFLATWFEKNFVLLDSLASQIPLLRNDMEDTNQKLDKIDGRISEVHMDVRAIRSQTDK